MPKATVPTTIALDNLDVFLKLKRLKQWCADINRAQQEVHHDFVFVEEVGFKKY